MRPAFHGGLSLRHPPATIAAFPGRAGNAICAADGRAEQVEASRFNGSSCSRLGFTGMQQIAVLFSATLLLGAAQPVPFSDLATPFEQVAIRSAGQPMALRTAAIRRAMNSILPGVYPAGASTDARIATALSEFPNKRAAYDRIVRGFRAALESAVARFRNVFPDFTSPLPIFLYHSLGTRDGGSDFVEPGHRLVMLFGADMIAKLHADDSLQPFMDHELFHLEHARHFPDCDQFWCAIWQEGLAVSAAAATTPHATDHQLLLDTPVAIRPATEAHWKEALCHVSAHFDDTDSKAVSEALMTGGKPPAELPSRFGYYVGYRVAQATGISVVKLDRLDNQAARPVVRAALVRLIREAGAICAPPAAQGETTHSAPHPV